MPAGPGVPVAPGLARWFQNLARCGSEMRSGSSSTACAPDVATTTASDDTDHAPVPRPTVAGFALLPVLPLACALHCLITPALVVFVPVLAFHGPVEWVLIGMSALLGGVVLFRGVPTHGRRGLWFLGGTGVALWAASSAGVFAPLPEAFTAPPGGLLLAATLYWNNRLVHLCSCASGPARAAGRVAPLTAAVRGGRPTLTTLALLVALAAPLGAHGAASGHGADFDPTPPFPAPEPGDPIVLGWRDLAGLDLRTGQKSDLLDRADGQTVRIPGFMVPLEDFATSVAVFLLVPWMGACIHTPPPPPNQMVFVQTAGGGKVRVDIAKPIWLEGRLDVVAMESPYGSVGYTMEAFRIEPYGP